MKPMRQIPISVAEWIAKQYTYDQVIVYARKVGDEGGEHMTTYGVNKEHCDVAARIGDFLKYKIMGWERDDGVSSEYERGRKSVLDAITYTTDEGEIHNSFHDYVDLREKL